MNRILSLCLAAALAASSLSVSAGVPGFKPPKLLPPPKLPPLPPVDLCRGPTSPFDDPIPFSLGKQRQTGESFFEGRAAIFAESRRPLHWTRLDGKTLDETPQAHHRFRRLGLHLPGDPSGWHWSLVHDTGSGPVILRLRRLVNGAPVARHQLNFVLDRQGRMTGLTGGLEQLDEPVIKQSRQPAARRAPGGKSLAEVIPALVADMTGDRPGLRWAPGTGRQDARTPDVRTPNARTWVPPKAAAMSRDNRIRTKTVYWPQDDRLIRARQIEIPVMFTASGEPRSARYIVDEAGRVLSKTDLIDRYEPYRYRVFADSSGQPHDTPFGHVLPHPDGAPTGWVPTTPAAQSLIEVAETSDVRDDPWLPDGATETVGNNVDAFYNSIIDSTGNINRAVAYGPELQPADGDFRATITSPGVFDYEYDVAAAPDDYHQTIFGEPYDPPTADDPQLNAKIVHAFYVTNRLHDEFYDAGFDEAAGNAQQDNFGRGGIDGDRLLVHAGYSGTYVNPRADGESPIIHMGINGFSSSNKDGTLSLSVLGHEWTHYMVRRLVGGGSMDNLSTSQAHSLNEGWADFIGHFLTIEASDGLPPGSPDWDGTYAVGPYFNSDYDPYPVWDGLGTADPDAYYYGVRRYPITVDENRNPLSFRHLEHDVALPADIPFYDWKTRSLYNAEVHSAGEIWAVALWEAYHDLLEQRPALTFENKRERMAEYLVAGMKATPSNPTYLEARNALLAAVRATDLQDYEIFRQAFARRGMGNGALAPDRESLDFAGVSESRHSGERALAVTSVAVDDRHHSLDDDGILDNCEAGELTVTARNTGFRELPAVPADLYVKVGDDAPVWLGIFDFAGTVPGKSVSVSTELPMAGAGFHDDLEVLVRLRGSTADTMPERQFRDRLAVNFDVEQDSRADSVAFPETFAGWTVEEEPSRHPADPEWRRGELDGNPVYRVMYRHARVEADLVSPPLEVASDRDFVIELDHAWDFTSATSFPRGTHRIEVSEDGGDTWTDTGLIGGTTTSAGYPALVTETFNLGSAYAGKTVQVRFVTDLGYHAAPNDVDKTGWAIGNIEFRGIDNQPLLAVRPD